VAHHLEEAGWNVQQADAEMGQRGPDVLAILGSRTLVVEVKAYPSTRYRRGPKEGHPKPTDPRLQAKHWYSDALLSILLRRQTRPTGELALAFPDLPRYRELITHTEYALRGLGLGVYLVRQNGQVQEFFHPGARRSEWALGGLQMKNEESLWTFLPVYPEMWANISPRVFIVGAEPNDDQPRPAQKDMGEWFRTAYPDNGYWENPKFYRATMLQLRAVMGRPLKAPARVHEDKEDLRHLRYLDLKATGGRSRANTDEIAGWVKEHIDDVISYWGEDRPDATVLQGNHAQKVFEEVLGPELRRRSIEVQRVGLPHPARGGYDLMAMEDARNHLRPLGDLLHRWSRRKRRWEK